MYGQQAVTEECVLPPPEARFVQSYLDEAGLMRYVKTREDLPTYSEEQKFDLFYMESIVSAASGGVVEEVMKAFNQYHSAIRAEFTIEDGTRKMFVLEFWGNGESTVAPYCVDDSGPKWQDNTVVVFTDGWVRSKWFGSKTQGVKVAQIDGAGINSLLDYAYEEWAINPKRKTYMQWQWWPSMHPGADQKHTNYDLICDSFTEALIWKMAELGAEFDEKIPILRRNYGVILQREPPEYKSATDPLVISFYQDVIERGQMFFFSADLEGHGIVIYDQVEDQYLYFDGAKVLVKYSAMPLPPVFYETCSKNAIGTCGLLPCYPWRHAQCVEGECKCQATQCAFYGNFGHYCKGPETPRLQSDAQASTRAGTSDILRVGAACCGLAFLVAVCAVLRFEKRGERLLQPEPLG